MIVCPSTLPPQPYDKQQLLQLVSKFKEVTEADAQIYVNTIIQIISDNFNDTDLIDDNTIKQITKLFLRAHSSSTIAEIFKYSVLSELYNLYAYYPMHYLKNYLFEEFGFFA